MASSSYRAVLSGDGSPGPIEQRIGRRLVRLVRPESGEGRELLAARRVELVGPEGSSLGRISLDDAMEMLRRRLERRLADPEWEPEREVLREGLQRLRDRSFRKGNA
jgi:hypothetical protein